MSKRTSYTPEQDDALRSLYLRHRSDWAHHAREYPELAGRSTISMRNRLFHELHVGTMERGETQKPTVLRGWPPLGTRLFFTDPVALRDHGSPERLPLPQPYRSLSGCSAAWLVRE